MKAFLSKYEEIMFDRIAEMFIKKGIDELLDPKIPSQQKGLNEESVKKVMSVAYNIAADAIEEREIVFDKRTDG